MPRTSGSRRDQQVGGRNLLAVERHQARRGRGAPRCRSLAWRGVPERPRTPRGPFNTARRLSECIAGPTGRPAREELVAVEITVDGDLREGENMQPVRHLAVRPGLTYATLPAVLWMSASAP